MGNQQAGDSQQVIQNLPSQREEQEQQEEQQQKEQQQKEKVLHGLRSNLSKQGKTINLEEFGKNLGILGLTEPGLIPILYRAFDKDGNGILTPEEFLIGMSNLTSELLTIQDRLNFAFAVFDKDGDGKISFSEVKSLVEILHSISKSKFDEKSLHEFFSKLDVDGSGGIDLNEFLKVEKKPDVLNLLGFGDLISTVNTGNLKKGKAIVFGNEKWNLILIIMQGISTDVKKSAAVESNKLIEADFHEKIETPLGSLFSDSHLNSLGNKFTVFAGRVFHDIRRKFGVDSKMFLNSLGVEQVVSKLLVGRLSSFSELKSEGKSGQHFFFSHDGLFLVKTLSAKEQQKLLAMLPSYYEYITKNPSTLLPRYYGLYYISYSGTHFYFIITENVFKTNKKLEVYDLKGSTVGRTSEKDEHEEGKSSGGPKKDLDLKEPVTVGPTYRQKVLKQILLDSTFLNENHIVDYSMLLGIHTTTSATKETMANDGPQFSEFQQEEGGIYSRDSSDAIFPSTLVSSDTPVPKKIYYFGIIDSLIPYDFAKTAEHGFKSLVYGEGISIVPPDMYASRFNKFLSGVLQ